MKFVALLSGGKDSCYNLSHCSLNGHELVAAASLRPEPGKEEIDSYLYQTVGQDAIEYVARALGVPLYRQVIQGTSIEQGSEYGGREPKTAGGILGDETEDLYTLLCRVKYCHPDVQGVSVGTILSNYQRVRVEHVCQRLDLTPLCYLWQRNQADLLGEMVKAGVEAILIKVAGAGLNRAHLGKTLAEVQLTLCNLHVLYGSHICGEGGEYETLTLDCPQFKHRLALTDTETVIHSDGDFATVAFLRINGVQLEPKPTTAQHAIFVPPLLDDVFEAVQAAVLSSQLVSIPTLLDLEIRHPKATPSRIRQSEKWVAISNIYCPQQNGSTVEEEVFHCFRLLSELLATYKLQLSNCVMISVFLNSIDIFMVVNAIYSTFFGVSPPARACVSVDLPEGTRVKFDCLACSEHEFGARQALHVQGLSYWAPANIGPYSQAIVASDRVFISGQIGLIPSHLVIPFPQCLATEMALSCQHISRIISALKTPAEGWEGHIQLNVYWLATSSVPSVKRGHRSLQGPPAPTIFLQVKELPKKALVEKQVYIHTGRVKSMDDDGDEVIRSPSPSFYQDEFICQDGNLFRWELSTLAEDGTSYILIFFKRGFIQRNSQRYPKLSVLFSYLRSVLSTKYFYVPRGGELLEPMCIYLFETDPPPITPIPCRRISSLQDDTWDGAFCIISLLTEKL